jgi:hypothetical protein
MLLMNWAVTFFRTHAFGGRSGPLSRSPKLIDAAGILSGFAAQKNSSILRAVSIQLLTPRERPFGRIDCTRSVSTLSRVSKAND